MVRKRLDERVRTLLERGVKTGERSMLVLVGDHGKDQVANLHYLLSKASVKARPSVLWCYKKELGFSTHKKKRMKKLQKKLKGLKTESDMDQFELFLSQTNINWCYYRDTHRVLGTTVGMLVLQDFEALTANLLARTIETVEGGGLIIFLLRTVKSLKQLYAMTMDVHSRYRTEAQADLIPRFNERFILSLGKCQNCLVCDDELNVLPLSKSALKKLGTDISSSIQKGDAGEVLMELTPDGRELESLKESLVDTPHVGVLVDMAMTIDQAKGMLVVLETLSTNSAKGVIAMTAGRGRGKSAAMGLSLAGAISLGYSQIGVTAPAPENLVAVFDFVVRGLNALKYQEHLDYTLKYNSARGRDETKCVIAVHLHRNHRQVIRYIVPTEADKLASAEIVAIDEAAAIPLPVVKKLMNPDRLTILSSTINGYEGTGRALSLKLIKDLREQKSSTGKDAATAAANAIIGPKAKKSEAKVHEQRWAAAAAAAIDSNTRESSLKEVELTTPIRYAVGDPIEAWLNGLLCLDCGNNISLKLSGGMPAPNDCELYSVDRDALFSFHKLSESFLQKLMGLYTSAHYKNSPNDLQMLSDAPAHSIYCLLSPSAEHDSNSLPDVLAVVQVALEGKISRKSVEAQLARGHRSAGDMIPWTISQQFGDSKFAQLSGARIVRIATHPSLQGMGYGTRAVEMLYRFYNGEMVNLEGNNDDDQNENDDDDQNQNDDESSEEENSVSSNQKDIKGEKLAPRKELPPLLLPLTEVEAPRLDWIGTSFGITAPLHRFWTRSGMKLLYLRQTANELTGEHSTIMVRAISNCTGVDNAWLQAFGNDFQRRMLSFLTGPFQEMPIRLAMAVLESLGSGNKAGATSQDTAGNTNFQTTHGCLSTSKISIDELNYLLTPHDLKRLELYGRNLCDHHLVTDLLSCVARLYFLGRLGPDFNISSLQAALLCGIGIQMKSVDSLTSDLGLPSNQVLAMFNKAVRKVSIALNAIVEEHEKERMVRSGGKQQRKAHEAIESKMDDVAHQTLQEDLKEGAIASMSKLTTHVSNDPKIMQYAIKGSDDQWSQALKDRNEVQDGMISIKSVRPVKRKLCKDDIERESQINDPSRSEKKNKKKRKKGKK
eukprot:CAMPEP_0194154674 /NCGR_PEP_ID=MMETSP0152-20130528/61524_1 /TAXON_ID=1049557 /ORGANISM="Thalassiothrix antarctica, Strain L6-D1" /LENGTH=1114 /DNA_ID=CAMNT_0038860931 /DNA_START=32 /DNA_END=3376 /DNA_ORIENTATION=+